MTDALSLRAEAERLAKESLAWDGHSRANQIDALKQCVRDLLAQFTAAEAQLQADRETITRLNRRCQLAEAAANLKVDEWGKRSTGQGRAYVFQLGKDVGRAEAEAQIAEAITVLAPNMPESGLVDACRQVKQVAISEADTRRRRTDEEEANGVELDALLLGDDAECDRDAVSLGSQARGDGTGGT